MHIIKTGRHLHQCFEVSWGAGVWPQPSLCCALRRREVKTLFCCVWDSYRTKTASPRKKSCRVCPRHQAETLWPRPIRCEEPQYRQSIKTLRPCSVCFNGQNVNFLFIVPWKGLQPQGVHWVTGKTGRTRSERAGNKTSVVSILWLLSISVVWESIIMKHVWKTWHKTTRRFYKVDGELSHNEALFVFVIVK